MIERTHRHPYLHYKAQATDTATQHGNTLTGASATTTTRQCLATQSCHGNKLQHLHQLQENNTYVRHDTPPFRIHSRFTGYSLRGPKLEPFCCSAELQVYAPHFLALHQSITITVWPLRATPGFLKVIQVVFKQMGAAGWEDSGTWMLPLRCKSLPGQEDLLPPTDSVQPQSAVTKCVGWM